jgi:tetratricopeptide (TPR) repeat protein/transglutaminase-like putative cysteine protease
VYKIVRTIGIEAIHNNGVFPRAWKQLVATLLSASLLSVGFAQKPSETPPNASHDFSKEAYTLERFATRITAEADGTGSRELTAEIKILADAGVKTFAVLNFTYTSANETVEIEYVRVRKPDGSITKTPDYNIQDMPADVTRTAPLYSDIHEKHIAVKGLGVGDVLEYALRYRIVKPEVPGQFWYEYSFVKNAIAKDELLEISFPAGKYLKVVSPEFKPEVVDEGARRVFRWKYSNLTAKEKDPNEPPRRFPPAPDVQATTFASWEEVGNWYKGLQKDPLQVTPAIRAKTAELTKGLTTDEEKIRAIYKFVSLKYHYIGLDFGIGRYQPHAADDVLDNGYGDCKDKHTLLAALLEAAGIDAWPVLIHDRRKLEPDVPSPAQFDHVITVVPLGGSLIWLDTTPEVSPYGLILLTLRNKQALVIPTAKPPVLITTPENPPFPQEQKFSMNGKLSADGTFTGHAEQSYRGDSEVWLRDVFRQVSESHWKETVQRFSQNLNFGGDVSNVKVTPPDDLDRAFEVSYDYVRKKYGDWDNRQIIPPLPPMGFEAGENSRAKKPMDPVVLGAVGKITYRSRVELPAGYTATAPVKIHFDEPYAEFTDDTQIDKGIMTTKRELIIKKTEVPVEEWDGFRKIGRAVFDHESRFIQLNGTFAAIGNNAGSKADEGVADENDVGRLFDRGIDALKHRDNTRAQELFEKVIAKDPQHPAAHLNLGYALARQNRHADALSEFRKEEEISPNDPQSFRMAAAAANLTGNTDEAIVELRKLLKVHPADATGAAALADLLSRQGKYSEVVEVLEAALKVGPDSPNLQYLLGRAYLKTGEKDKAVSYLQKAAGQQNADPMVLNNVAYALADAKTDLDSARQYAEKALMVVEERSLDYVKPTDTRLRVTYELALLWDTLGWIYFQSGDTDRAESFVRSAWLLGLHPIVGEHLGEIYEKQGKTKMAAKTYGLAFAANEAPAPAVRVGLGSASATETNEQEALNQQLTLRYKKLTGKTPAIRESVRLANGTWTKSVIDELRQLRTIDFGKRPGLSGSAEFLIVFAPGKIEAVEQLTGEKSLDILMAKLDAGSVHVEFPAGSGAKILRRAQVSCFPLSGCVAVLTPASAASAGPAVGAN